MAISWPGVLVLWRQRFYPLVHDLILPFYLWFFAVTESISRTDPIGGFLGLEPAGCGDLLSYWGARDAPGWVNATSALAALVTRLRPRRVWLPGYICAELVGAVPPQARRFFPLTDDLCPDIAALKRELVPGDMVLAVNMFGCAPGPAWRDFVAAHPGVSFVEDCAQTLETGEAAWGDWRLYSPRKLVGVPEGGLLVPISARAEARAPHIHPDMALQVDQRPGCQTRLAPLLARQDAPQDNALWHPLHQAAEASHRISAAPMSLLARDMLSRLDPAAMITARKRNYAHLSRVLGGHALWPETDPQFAPSGFAVRVAAQRRAGVLAHLHGHKIFAAVHWRDIPAPAGFVADHARAASLITLPCDHRYGVGEMQTVAEVFLAACR